MSEFNINIPSGQRKRLLTAGTYCPDNILVTTVSPAAIEEKDVNFWDYDGTLLYSYTLQEVQSMTQLPSPPMPKHDFLTFTNWNWSLDSIKDYGKTMDVGAIYTTKDGQTRLFLEIPSDFLKRISLYFIQTVSVGAAIDWGDGSVPETISGSGAVSISHEYAAKGQYVIRLSVMSGTVTLGWNDGTNGILGDDRYMNRSIKACLGKVFIGPSVKLGQYTFWNCVGVTEISLPENIALGAAAFNACRSLRHLNLPRSLTNLTNQMCSTCEALRLLVPGENVQTLSANMVIYCHGLRRGCAFPKAQALGYGTYYECYAIIRIDLGENTTSIGGSAMTNVLLATELTIPARVTSIAASAFSGMCGLRKLRFIPTAPPAVANANAFNSIPTNCVVEVPAESLSAYQSATNYAPIAAQMVGGITDDQN